MSQLMLHTFAAGDPVQTANMTDAEYTELLGRLHFGSRIQETLGPVLFGMGIDLILCGVMVHQAILWANNWRQERKFNLFITLWLIAAGLAMSCVDVWYAWNVFVSHFGTFSELLKMNKIAVFPLLAIATTIPTQAFYLERAYRLLKCPLWLLALLIPFMVVSIAGGIGTFTLASQLEWQNNRKLDWSLYLWLGGTMVADVLLTAFMLWGLSRNRTGWTTTDRLVDRLIRTAIETQLPGSIVALAFMINFAVDSQSFVIIMWDMFNAKVYVVCLLAVLNYRYTLRATLNSDGEVYDTNKGNNTFALKSSRHQQRTVMNLDDIRVDTVVHEASYEIAEDKIRINRARMADEESGHSETDGPDEYSSTIVLTSNGQPQ